jgi:hypothetical protein
MHISVEVGQEQPLQVLDLAGNELAATDWSVDNPEVAEIRHESGQVAVYAKAAGVVHVSALVEGTTLGGEIRVWLPEPGMRITGPLWVVPSIGRELAALQAAPTPDGPDFFTLDQNDRVRYVRALTNRGLQLWIWRLPESGGRAELLCADNTGGAILSVARADAYRLYVVGKNGNLEWQHQFHGIRKGYALNASNLLHLLTRSADGTSIALSAWDGSSGKEEFSLKIPSSEEYEVNVQRSGGTFICAPGRSVPHPIHADVSDLFVNTDGDAYAAFTVKHWTLEADKCAAGSMVGAQKIYLSRNDQLVLWRIQSDGSHRDIVIDSSTQSRAPFPAPLAEASPTGGIIPDGLGGVLLSVRSVSNSAASKTVDSSQEFVYRITEDGSIAYRFPLPPYTGDLHDEMVLGEQDLGFATRGAMLIAFNVRNGSEVWRWNSGISELKINMATAGGGCIVDTSNGLVLVEEGVRKQVVAPHGSDMYVPGLFIEDDPHGLALVATGFRSE